MAGHWHDPSAATQNQGNQLGTRPCVRQSQLFRQNESGNTMKSLLGSSHLQWDTKHTQGAYAGRPAYDASAHFASTTSVAGRYHCARRRPNPYPCLRDGADVDETPSSVLLLHGHAIAATPHQKRRRERDDEPLPRAPQEGVGRPGTL